ncbi:hypothetical protein IL099_002187 [Enterococcus hirae]|nr:hypothetical protein [Enterococcus hirae]
MKKAFQLLSAIFIAFWQGFFPLKQENIFRDSNEKREINQTQEVQIVEQDGYVKITVGNESDDRSKKKENIEYADKINVKIEKEPHVLGSKTSSFFGMKLRNLSGNILYGERMKKDE